MTISVYVCAIISEIEMPANGIEANLNYLNETGETLGSDMQQLIIPNHAR